MVKEIYDIMQQVTVALYITNLFFALRLRKMSLSNDIFYNFFWYPLIGCCIGIAYELYFFEVLNKDIYKVIINSSILFHYAFLSFFIFKAVGYKIIMKRFILINFIVVVALVVFDILAYSTVSAGYANAILCGLCIYYFYFLLDNPNVPILFSNPIFLIVVGIFIGCVFIFPFSILNKYIAKSHISRNSVYILGTIGRMGPVIMNIVFLKALLCKFQLSKS